MKDDEQIVNKVASSGLLNIDLNDWYDRTPRKQFDLKPLLFQELILREKDLREFIEKHNFEEYKNTYVALYCSADAVIPTWAYMLLTIHMQPFAKRIFYGTLGEMNTILFDETLHSIDLEMYRNQRVIIKGCSEEVPVSAYVTITEKLKPIVKSLMFGEACSTVPLFKKKEK